jgi:DsbC/DsbD-like thiol-disulfide interchange protein
MRLLAFISLLLIATPAWAGLTVAPHVQVELLADGASIQPGRDATVGVHFLLEEGWHVYWRNPGDS